MLPQENFENIVVIVLNFNQFYTVMPLNMDYLLWNLVSIKPFHFSRLCIKT